MDMISWAEGLGTNPEAILSRADALRDGHLWTEAASAYASFLALRPEAWAIRVQYGHCLKESGDAPSALQAYREAELLQPEDGDIHLQIARKRRKRFDRGGINPEGGIAHNRPSLAEGAAVVGGRCGRREPRERAL